MYNECAANVCVTATCSVGSANVSATDASKTSRYPVQKAHQLFHLLFESGTAAFLVFLDLLVFFGSGTGDSGGVTTRSFKLLKFILIFL